MLGKRHYEVQVMAGLALLRNGMVEMATGEGKTLTALSPVILRAMRGLGVHVVTANPYLAQRDAELMSPVYEFAGLSVGCLKEDLDARGKQEQYDRDVTYGTGSDFGFDYLRDCLHLGPSRTAQAPGRRESGQVMQRGHYFALIDEADVILIDDSGTPLIIGAEEDVSEADLQALQWASSTARQLQAGKHFGFDVRTRRVWLTRAGTDRIALVPKPQELNSLGTEQLLKRTEKALTAMLLYERDRDYIVTDDQVQIVGEGTGRVLSGRKWQDGLHQAVETREQLPVTGAAAVAARITVQQYYRKYRHLSGMTGTAASVAREVKKYFRLRVTKVPTNRPCRRRGLQPRVFTSLQTKHAAIHARVSELAAADRAVLIGVPSVE